MIEVERYLDFLEKNRLNQAQFMLMYLLFFKKYELLVKYKKMYPSDDGSAIGKHSYNDLIEREFIKETNEEGLAKHIVLTDKFSKIFVDKFECAKEIWKLYPSFVLSEGKRFPLTLCDEDVFREKYAEKINHSREEHIEVMKDLKYAVEKNLIKGKIDTFVASRHWLAIRKERLGNGEADRRFVKEQF